MAKPKKKYTEPVSLPMLGLMVFPHMVLHFDAGRKKSIAALDQAMEENQRIFLVAQRDMDVDDPAVDDIYHVGTIACVKQVLRLPGGNVRLLVEGKSRAVLRAVTQEEPYFVGALDEVLEQGTPVSIETDALLRTAHHYFEEYCKMSGRISGETMQSVLEIEDPGQLADIIAANVLSKIEDRQQRNLTSWRGWNPSARCSCAKPNWRAWRRRFRRAFASRLSRTRRIISCGSRSRRFRPS